MIIVGLGTGRCGTRSLAALLDAQSTVAAQHERKPCIGWRDDVPDFHIRNFREQGEPHYADVGFYYLPHVETLLDKYRDIRFVCLQRDRQQTIDSFCRSSHGDWFAPGDGWNRCFPDYEPAPFDEQVGRYWDEYYERAESIYDSRFRVFPTESLSDPAGIAAILNFAGIDDPNIVPQHITDTPIPLEV